MSPLLNMYCKYRLPVSGLSYYSVFVIVWWADIFHFNKAQFTNPFFYDYMSLLFVNCARNLCWPQVHEDMFCVFFYKLHFLIFCIQANHPFHINFFIWYAAAAAAKSLQSCPTLCDPIDGSPWGFSIPGFSRQEYWSGLPFPSPVNESEKCIWYSQGLFFSI